MGFTHIHNKYGIIYNNNMSIKYKKFDLPLLSFFSSLKVIEIVLLDRSFNNLECSVNSKGFSLFIY